MVSAHWENAPVTLSATTGASPSSTTSAASRRSTTRSRTTPRRRPGSPTDVELLVAGHGHHVERDETRGLDHGAYVPLKEMFPEADIPVLQMSMPTLDPQGLFDLGRKLAPLRDRGTLIVGSGFTTHNLRWFNPAGGAGQHPAGRLREFDHWAAGGHGARRRRLPSSTSCTRPRPPARRTRAPSTGRRSTWPSARPTSPASLDAKTAIDGFWFGLSKRSWTLT